MIPTKRRWPSTLDEPDDILEMQARVHARGGLSHPTHYKNWDLGLFTEVILERVGMDEPVLDLGCVSNPLLTNLARIGYQALVGIDLGIVIDDEPRHPAVRRVSADLQRTPFAAGTFACATALSTIEHGVDLARFFDEMRRILRVGGVLLVSTDFWEDKVSTRLVPRQVTFGLPWNIFSRREMLELVALARVKGFELLWPFDPTAVDPVVLWLHRRYTFAAIGLVRTA